MEWYQKSQYCFLDVETPNGKNDRICSIGMVVTDMHGNIKDKRYLLVNPETHYDAMNTRIHGISEVHTADKLPFSAYWQHLGPIIESSYVVAHNASFDMTVLGKTLAAYGIQTQVIPCICTQRMAGASERFSNLKLDRLCEEIGVQIGDHHNAFDDAMACNELFWNLVRGGTRVTCEPFYDGRIQRQKEKRKSKGFRGSPNISDSSAEFNFFLTMVSHIISDGEITYDEAELVVSMYNDGATLHRNPSLAPVIERFERCMMDGVISDEESAELVEIVSKLIDPTSCGCGSVEISGKRFVLTGDFEYGDRSDVEQFVTDNGGEISKSVTMKCDYVVVGSNGSDAWAHGNYGAKVKKAIDYQAKGASIKVISESDLFCGR